MASPDRNHLERAAETLAVPGLGEQIRVMRQVYPELSVEAIARILRLPLDLATRLAQED